jgi:DNA mismatch repair ATPase MutS
MDEVGRGTTPEDGIALAFACLHHLYFVNRARCLFATHFHVLADMAAGIMRVDGYGDGSDDDRNRNPNGDSNSDSNSSNGDDGMACFCTDVAEEEVVAAATIAVDGSSSSSSSPPRSFSYVHRLRRGVNRKSHALKVAQVAGK